MERSPTFIKFWEKNNSKFWKIFNLLCIVFGVFYKLLSLFRNFSTILFGCFLEILVNKKGGMMGYFFVTQGKYYYAIYKFLVTILELFPMALLFFSLTQ